MERSIILAYMAQSSIQRSPGQRRTMKQVSIALFCLLLSFVDAALRGEIVACSGCSLKRFPDLRHFLKGGEAETYHGVSVTFEKGHDPILTLYEDREVVEVIRLEDHSDLWALRALFKEKGFEKRTEEGLQAFHKLKRQKEKFKKEKQKRLLNERKQQNEGGRHLDADELQKRRDEYLETLRKRQSLKKDDVASEESAAKGSQSDSEGSLVEEVNTMVHAEL
jgi:hypothetical protein